MSQAQWNPPNFQNLVQRIQSDPTGLGVDIDLAIQTVNRQQVQSSSTLAGMKNGLTTVTGQSLRVSTGLSSVTNVLASIESSLPINEWVTVAPGLNGMIALYVWTVTGVSDTTPIPSTTPRTIRWAAWGQA